MSGDCKRSNKCEDLCLQERYFSLWPRQVTYGRGEHFLFSGCLHEVSANHWEDSAHDKIFPGATDEGFRDEIGLCIRVGKGFQALHVQYEFICITLSI